MKKAILLGLLVISILLISCTKNNTATGAVVNTGDVKVESNVVDENWCSPGSDWKMTGADASAEWKVIEQVVGGEYAGLCHVIYTMNSGSEEVVVDYYFSEDGMYGFVETKLPNGHVSKQEWHG